MAVSNEGFQVTYLAGEAITLGVAVMMSTAADKTVLIATSGEKAIGVCTMGVASGAAVPICIMGRVKVKCGAAVTHGDDLSLDGSGRFILSAGGGANEVVARAEESQAVGADVYISALLVGRAAATP